MRVWPFAAVLFVFFMLISLSYALSGLGGTCNSTGDCEKGYCLSAICYDPSVSTFTSPQNCTKTADCMEGYCLNQTCILPTTKANLFGISPKSGCAGVTDQAYSLGPISICDAIWLLLIFCSAASGYYSSKRGDARLVSLAVLLLPIFLGILFLPFIGLISALIEIGLISSKKRKR